MRIDVRCSIPCVCVLLMKGVLLSDSQFHALPNFALQSGTIPKELAKCPKLAILALYGNSLTGSIPSHLGGLSHLTDLQIHENLLTNTIPSEIGLLSKLLDISVASNYLTGSIPSEIGVLNRMLDVRLYDNFLTGPVSLHNRLASAHSLEILPHLVYSHATPANRYLPNLVCLVV